MNHKKEKLLILDLDETLIYASKETLQHPPHFEFDKYFVYKRPYVDEFLVNASNHFHLAIWSSAGDDYVKLIK